MTSHLSGDADIDKYLLEYFTGGGSAQRQTRYFCGVDRMDNQGTLKGFKPGG